MWYEIYFWLTQSSDMNCEATNLTAYDRWQARSTLSGLHIIDLCVCVCTHQTGMDGQIFMIHRVYFNSNKYTRLMEAFQTSSIFKIDILTIKNIVVTIQSHSAHYVLPIPVPKITIIFQDHYHRLKTAVISSNNTTFTQRFRGRPNTQLSSRRSSSRLRCKCVLRWAKPIQ